MSELETEWDVDLEESAPTAESLDVATQKAPIIELLRTSGEFFIDFFLHTELTFQVPLFHIQIWAMLTNVTLQRVLLAIPRDHAKTTLSKLCVVWYFLFTNHRFCVYLSNTNTIAKNACRDIMGYIQSDNFAMVFGKPRILKDSESESLWIFEITLPNGKIKKCILRAVGAGQQMRGINVDNQRPDITVIDDVEDGDNTESETLQKKLDKWMFATFLKALAKQKKIIWLGNMLQKTSLLSRLSIRPRWNPVVFGCLVRHPETGQIVPLWPDRWPIEELIEDFKEYVELGQVEAWMCEMMNMPGHGRNGFTIDNLFTVPKPIPGDQQCAWLCLDPAFGEKEHNDNSSITVHIINKDGLPIVAEDYTGKFTESEIFDTMLMCARRWDAWVWGMEAVAAQKVLISLFKVYAALQMLNNHIEMIPLISGRGDPKISRIKGFVNLMGKKEYAISEDMVTFITQMLAYNMTKRSNDDDLLDSSAYGPTMIQNYLPLIEAASSGMDDEDYFGKARFGMEVSNV